MPDVPVPESAWHDGCLELLKALLVAWVARTGRNAAVFRDIAILAKQADRRVGFNPDLSVVEPAPVGAATLESMKLWENSAPRLAFEVVSPSHPYKDYSIVPEKCAVTGVGALVVFDPLLAGPSPGRPLAAPGLAAHGRRGIRALLRRRRSNILRAARRLALCKLGRAQASPRRACGRPRALADLGASGTRTG